MKPSLQPTLAELDQKRIDTIFLSRVFGRHFKKLRALPRPDISVSNYYFRSLELVWSHTFSDMRQAEKYLTKWATFIPVEKITSEDSDISGSRVFRATLLDSKNNLRLTLCLIARPDTENPHANCRRVQVGEITETSTHTRPKYAIICD